MSQINQSIVRMQEYIEAHLQEEIILEELGQAAGYAKEYACKLFCKHTGLTVFEYARKRRLSRAALQLVDPHKRVLDVAMECMFDSHEGFTRAFTRFFGISPIRYRKETPQLPMFMPYTPFFMTSKNIKEDDTMQSNVIFTQIIQRPARRLFLLRGKVSTEYFAFCEEMGCDVWGKLLAVKNPLQEPIGMWMPDALRPAGTSFYTQGVEVALDDPQRVPQGMEELALPACTYLYFHSQPYEEERMGEVIGIVQKAMESYDPAFYGYAWADDLAPRFQFAPMGERGYIEARPVKSLPR